MDRPFAELILTIIGGVLAIFTVAVTLLRRWRTSQLRRINHQLDEVVADSVTIENE
jgi:hypothetical protein